MINVLKDYFDQLKANYEYNQEKGIISVFVNQENPIRVLLWHIEIINVLQFYCPKVYSISKPTAEYLDYLKGLLESENDHILFGRLLLTKVEETDDYVITYSNALALDRGPKGVFTKEELVEYLSFINFVSERIHEVVK